MGALEQDFFTGVHRRLQKEIPFQMIPQQEKPGPTLSHTPAHVLHSSWPVMEEAEAGSKEHPSAPSAARVVFVGSRGVGKTSLVCALLAATGVHEDVDVLDKTPGVKQCTGQYCLFCVVLCCFPFHSCIEAEVLPTPVKGHTEPILYVFCTSAIMSSLIDDADPWTVSPEQAPQLRENLDLILTDCKYKVKL